MRSKTEKRRYGSGVRPYVIRSAVEERSVEIIWDMLLGGERGGIRQAGQRSEAGRTLEGPRQRKF